MTLHELGSRIDQWHAAIVGRGSELRVLDQFLDDVRRGPAALTVEGDAGSGKTELWKATIAMALER